MAKPNDLYRELSNSIYDGNAIRLKKLLFEGAPIHSPYFSEMDDKDRYDNPDEILYLCLQCWNRTGKQKFDLLVQAGMRVDRTVLRTRIGSIKGLLDLIETVGRNITPEDKAHILSVYREGNRMLDIAKENRRIKHGVPSSQILKCEDLGSSAHACSIPVSN